MQTTFDGIVYFSRWNKKNFGNKFLFKNSFFSYSKENSHKKTVSVSASVLERMNLIDQLPPIEKGYNYLIDSCNAKRCFQPHVSQYSDFRISHRTPFPEIFDSILILDILEKRPFDYITKQSCLKYITDHQGSNKLFSFFEDSSLLPQDVDDTALATLILLKNQKITYSDAMRVADAIIANVDKNGIIQTYFPPCEGRDGRIDPSVCANALRLIHQLRRGDESLPTENYLYSYLEKKRALNNQTDSLYYGNCIFFYFMWEAIKVSSLLEKRFGSLFGDRLKADIGSTSNPIDLASRVVVSRELGLSNYMEIDKLYRLQQKDGSWPIDVAYTGSRKNLYWGSKMVSTAFALRALDDIKVTQLNEKMNTLPILSQGFNIQEGLLKYTNEFSPLFFKFRAVVVNHTETPSTQKSKFYESDKESPSNSLTERGKQEALSTAKKLKEELACHSMMIYHGDNKRTLQTAKIINEQFPTVSSQCVSWLNEINCFDWHGRETREILETNFSAQAMFLTSNCLAQPPQGQNFLEYLNGVYEGLLHLKNTQSEKSTVILCTSRVTIVAIKILLQRDVDFDKLGNIDWSTMAKKIKTGSVFIF